jgi:hypothetical protein
MIFPKIRTDRVAQVEDMIRIDCRQSVVSDFDLVNRFLIKVDDDATPIEIAASKVDDLFLDWIYEDDGDKEPELIIELVETEMSEDEVPVEVNKTVSKSALITILSVEDDNLFSDDNDILSNEPDLYRYLPEGRSSFLFAHREAQTRIMAFLDEQRIWKREDDSRYTTADIKDIEEFKHWSRFYALHIIFNSLVVSVGDIFEQKAKYYADMMTSARKRATLRLEQDENGEPQRLVDRVTSIQVRR